MNKQECLKMNSDELYEHLLSYVMENPIEAKDFLDSLGREERYRVDYEFRAFIDTSKLLLFNIYGQGEKVISRCTELLERSNTLGLWQLVSIHWNLLGSSYSSFHMFERALECYNHVIMNEKKHGLTDMESDVYNNIALIYMELEDYNEAYKYLQSAIEKLEEKGIRQLRYSSKFISYSSNLVIIFCKLNLTQKAIEIFEKMRRIHFNEINYVSKYSYYIAELYYSFFISDYQRAEQVYRESKEFIKNNTSKLFSLIFVYVELCLRFQLSFDFYIKDLLLLKNINLQSFTTDNITLYKELRNYYKHIGNRDEFEKLNDWYIECLEQNHNNIRKQRLYSLQVIQKAVKKDKNLKEVASRNSELTLIMDEALKNKKALEQAYQRIEMINELGRKITSSLNLAEVVALIYRNLKRNLPMDVFILFAVEKANHCLRSLVYYEENRLQPEFCISLDEERSVLVDCYKSKKLISSNDKKYNRIFEEYVKSQKRAKLNSAIYMPLKVGNDIIGICSVQYRIPNIYNKSHISFLEQLSPYLSIALNNAVYSRRLEKEIRSHLETQNKLEAANKRLEHISSIDGLTQISSRRDFDNKFMELLNIAKNKHSDILVLMLDVDNFKLYNDTYGHLEGDEALKQVANVFRKHMDAIGGLSARFGGEEFVGACIGLNYEESKDLAECIRRDVDELGIEHKATALGHLSISVGGAVAKGHDINGKSDVLRLADDSLYYAKNTGKNKVFINYLETE